jgi:hypothetical protein
MIILHENIPVEAQRIAEVLRQVYSFPVEIENRNMDNWFLPMKKFSGFWYYLSNDVEILSFRNP